MAALGIAQAIKDLIERHVDGRVSVIQDARPGDSGVWVQYASEYNAGESIVLRTNDKVEIHKVQCTDEVEGKSVIVLCEDVTELFFAEETWVQKTHNKQIVQDIVIGNPDHLSAYPAITVEVTSMNRVPFTLESVSDTYVVEIGVWMDATTYNDAYETVLNITDKAEHAIYKELYPLIDPFFLTTLSDDVARTDTVIRVDNDQALIPGSWVWLEDSRRRKKHNKVKDNSVGVVKLSFPAGGTFLAGDSVISPKVHLYDPRIEGISYDDASDQDHLLKSSTITYSIKLHRPRVKNSLV